MKLVLYNYDDRPREYEIRDDVSFILINVISGDEVATISYYDGSTEVLDADESRFEDYFDGGYVLNTLEKIRIFNDFVPDNNSNLESASIQRMFFMKRF